MLILDVNLLPVASDGCLLSAICFPLILIFPVLQFCRYLFYLGKIRTIQLEYTDAKESLLQAARKAPVAALGFRIQCTKWVVIVRYCLERYLRGPFLCKKEWKRL